MGDKSRGLYSEGKFVVLRKDGTDHEGGKHDGCEYFVLDITHDPHAIPALRAYAASARKDGYELLANDLDRIAATPSPETAVPEALSRASKLCRSTIPGARVELIFQSLIDAQAVHKWLCGLTASETAVGGEAQLHVEMERDAMIDTINALERERNQAIAILKVALAATGCDGDLCNHRWHDDTRRLVADVESTDESRIAAPVHAAGNDEGVVALAIKTCGKCPFVDHSGAFTPGGAKATCGHRDAPDTFAATVEGDERYHWQHRQVDRSAAPPSQCPLRPENAAALRSGDKS